MEKQLTHSDELNIQVFKNLIASQNKDIEEVKKGNATESEKAIQIFASSNQRAHLIQNATKNYPHINWYNIGLGEESGFKQAERNTLRLKALYRLNLGIK